MVPKGACFRRPGHSTTQRSLCNFRSNIAYVFPVVCSLEVICTEVLKLELLLVVCISKKASFAFEFSCGVLDLFFFFGCYSYFECGLRCVGFFL